MTAAAEIPASQVAADVLRAMSEDLGDGDVTAALLPRSVRATAQVVCREAAVLAGGPWFEGCFRHLDADVAIRWQVGEGERTSAGDVVCSVHGNARAIVSGERAALNFLQTLSATATAAAAYVEAVAGTGATILDTRKTLPGLRLAQKYAVRAGGASNHRMGLHDAVMLKENHIAAAAAAARQLHPRLPLIIEVESLDELEQALAVAPTRILLDDFSLEEMRAGVRLSAGRVPLEVSGGVGLGTVRDIALTGVACISIGAITKHVRAIDFSLRLAPQPE